MLWFYIVRKIVLCVCLKLQKVSYSCRLHIFKCSYLPVVWNSWCFRGWKRSHRQSILRKRFAWFIHFMAFNVCWWIRESHWRECVSAAIENGKKRKSVWRRGIYGKYVSWNRLQKKRGTKFKRGRSLKQVT